MGYIVPPLPPPPDENDPRYINFYAPDPQEMGKMKLVGRTEKHPLLTTCVWCGSRYSDENDNCPNCGGPYRAKKLAPRKRPPPLVTTEYR